MKAATRIKALPHIVPTMLFRAVTSFHRKGCHATAVNVHVTTELHPRVTLQLPCLSENIGPSKWIRNLLLSTSSTLAADKEQAHCFGREGHLPVQHQVFSSIVLRISTLGYWAIVDTDNSFLLKITMRMSDVHQSFSSPLQSLPYSP